ncbi:hypothetical protein Acr_15g0008990 [Actinidia rufa]|uniref:Retrotransposon gag domain-containing protein n=1 Tax=Actinidia rufa TaxID=165716 RepID=A0A7J0FUD1_9ERIC|nr:hypothetical protein Acr_15g0008990 [Actinidia rufa]
MHLRSRYLPRPSASSPPDNRAPPMANTNQAPDLEGLHREIHGMAEQMRIMNENNARLVQLLAAANPLPPAAPPIPDLERSHHSNLLGGRSQNLTMGSEHTGGEGAFAETEPPFTERVLKARVSSRFKLPTQLGIYEGKTNPMDHLNSYKILMSLQGCSNEVMCKAFSATLKGSARSWFRKLLSGTIDSFGNLSRLFVTNFMSFRNRQKNAFHLFTVHQKETESLKDFVKRLNQTILEVKDPSDKVSKADKYIAAEELAEAKRKRRGKEDHKRKEPNTRHPRTPPHRPEFILSSLNAPVTQVLSKIKHEEFVKWPGKIKTDPQKRNRNKYYEFHRDHGHNTEDCFQLKEQIADLIKRGYLRKYVAARPPPNSLERRYGDNRPTAGDIQTIHGIKAITSTYHLKLKFPTSTGIGELKGDQRMARQCFISAMKIENLLDSDRPIAITDRGDHMEVLKDEVEQLTLADPRETENTKPLEEVAPISIHPDYPDRHIMIETELTNELRSALINFLKKNSDVFAWSQGDVPSINPKVAMHKLFANPEHSPVRQKRRKFAPERLKALADFIVESTHERTPEPEVAPPEMETPKEQSSEKDLACWELFVDGSSNQHSCGA